ncbi:MAG TPA: prepilin-type N-terminal cleavage/methylation domain-containing protein [Pyrinomonadaceae bacterium]|nr:prepilin-type N-terminal cleavage/methylation domain-containing protein [Pyrinomonadaceae bacterium]
MKISHPSPGRAAARGGQRGFTLAETAIAMLIMMVASVSVVSLFTYAIKYNAGAKDRELSMAVAQKRVEWLRSIPFDTTTRAVAYHYPDTANPAAGGLAATPVNGVTETATVAGRNYTVVTTIKNDGGAADAASTTKTITVKVTPVGADTALGQVILVTRRATQIKGAN